MPSYDVNRPQWGIDVHENYVHYNDVIMSVTASQITSLSGGLIRRRSKNTSKLRVTGLCLGNSPATGEFPTQMTSNAEYVFIWRRHHGLLTVGSGRDIACFALFHHSLPMTYVSFVGRSYFVVIINDVSLMSKPITRYLKTICRFREKTSTKTDVCLKLTIYHIYAINIFW